MIYVPTDVLDDILLNRTKQLTWRPSLLGSRPSQWALRLEAMAIWLTAIAFGLEAIAIRLEMLEAIAIRLRNRYIPDFRWQSLACSSRTESWNLMNW